MSDPRDDVRNLIEETQKPFPGKAKHRSYEDDPSHSPFSASENDFERSRQWPGEPTA